MKKAVILHGTDGAPDENWFPWIRRELESRGYEVYAPTLPNNHTPNREVYNKFLKDSGWDFADNILIGHSSGATTVLNLLSADWFPKVNAVILAGTFLNEDLTRGTDLDGTGQFDNLFLDKYDPSVISKKADKFYFIHGDNDPYCDINDAKDLCSQLKGEFMVVKNGHHLGETSGIKELPQLTDALKRDKIV